MVIPVFIVVQVALWHAGLITVSKGNAFHGDYATTPVLDRCDIEATADSASILSTALRMLRLTHPATSATAYLDRINKEHPRASFSGLGGTGKEPMLIPVFIVVQVSNKHAISSIRDDSLTLMVLPSPQFLLATVSDCIAVIRMLLIASGDVELNPGPSSDSESESSSPSEMLKIILKEQAKTNKRLKELTTNLKQVESTVDSIQKMVTSIEKEMGKLQTFEQKLAECEATCSNTSAQVSESLVKVDDLKNRSRRNNLIIYGINEEPEEDVKSLEDKIKHEVFKDVLEIEVTSVERIHRIGKYKNQHRLVIVRFYDFAEKAKILSCCNKLKGTDIVISEDFSKRMRDIRAKLWHSAADERANGVKVSRLYDKIKIDEKIFAWDSVNNRRIEVTSSTPAQKPSTKRKSAE
ncbi:hypothetical protein HPB48_004003 [Haemaphysalis longicornis]|uniref:Uncharacterized protein n=1 Tax=Haemaphysalis longicornis TaxID=44386 RepID=A0A9J6FYD4_HAELO|nr:hypothetical protein HPB48_004003 [Haemaphysalis longicornis]